MNEFIIFLMLAAALSMISAFFAKSKKRNMFNWFLYSFFIAGPIASGVCIAIIGEPGKMDTKDEKYTIIGMGIVGIMLQAVILFG